VNDAHIEAWAASHQPAAHGAVSPNLIIDSIQEDERLIPASPPPDPERQTQIGESNTLRASAAATPLHIPMPAEITPSITEDDSGLLSYAEGTLSESREDGSVYTHLDDEWIEAEVRDSLLGSEGVEALNDAEAMAEVRRLMGEIARTIEEAAQAVDRHDSFSMCLRAGQLKIADRYPFLDPFAGEFEYLAGEIVFVGQATAEEFIAGLTEALKLAAQAVMQSSGYAERFRAFVIEDLRKLQAANRSEFAKRGLDKVIDEIIYF
jgi:hypothetical protein